MGVINNKYLKGELNLLKFWKAANNVYSETARFSDSCKAEAGKKQIKNRIFSRFKFMNFSSLSIYHLKVIKLIKHERETDKFRPEKKPYKSTNNVYNNQK